MSVQSNLVAAEKQYTTGTHRVVCPDETFARARKLFGPLGVTRVANVTGLDCIGIPVVMVCRPNARSISVSQGKGVDLACARASGAMESIELFHAESVDAPLLLRTWNEMRFARRIVDVGRLPRTLHSGFHPERSLLWVEGVDIVASRSVWVPFELVHMNYTLPLPTGSGSFVMSSNGLASGNHPAEAIAHGLCELIERDAVALFRCQSEQRQLDAMVDPLTVDDAGCRELLARFETAGMAVGIWDMTSDVGVAAFRCVVLERDPHSPRRAMPVRGMGCHPAREVALARALTEAAQARLTLIAGSRDDNGRATYDLMSQRHRLETARRQLEQVPSRRFTAVPTCHQATVEQDITFIAERLRAVELDQIIVVSLTKPEFGIPVVRVIVPGLEPHHEQPGTLPGARAARMLADRRPIGAA